MRPLFRVQDFWHVGCVLNHVARRHRSGLNRWHHCRFSETSGQKPALALCLDGCGDCRSLMWHHWLRHPHQNGRNSTETTRIVGRHHRLGGGGHAHLHGVVDEKSLAPHQTAIGRLGAIGTESRPLARHRLGWHGFLGRGPRRLGIHLFLDCRDGTSTDLAHASGRVARYCRGDTHRLADFPMWLAHQFGQILQIHRCHHHHRGRRPALRLFARLP